MVEARLHWQCLLVKMSAISQAMSPLLALASLGGTTQNKIFLIWSVAKAGIVRAQYRRHFCSKICQYKCIFALKF